MRRTLQYILSAGALILTPATVWSLTLEEAWLLTRQHAPTLRMHMAEENAQKEQARAQAGQLRPQISFSAAIGRMDVTRTPTAGGADFQYDSDTRSWALTLTQALYRPDRWWQWRHSQTLISNRRWLTVTETLRLFTQMMPVYLNTVYSGAALNLLQQQQNRTRRLLEASQRRHQLGQGTRSDILQLQSRLQQAQADVEALVRQRDSLITQLSHYLGGRQLDPEQLEDWLPRLNELLARTADQPIETLIERMHRHHPELRALQAEIDAASDLIQIRLADHKPTVDLTIRRSMSDSDSINTLGYRYDTTSAEIRLNVPLYTGGSTSARVREARARLEAARARLEARRQELTLQMIQLHGDIRQRHAHWQALAQAAETARTLIDVEEKRYRAGQTDLTDLFQAERQWLDLEARKLQSGYQLIIDSLNLLTLTVSDPQQLFSPPAADRTASRTQASQ